jgi:phosphoribosylanthranilate isomerase
MLVKICGITNRGDALAAVDAGATALGFIFYSRSPRGVTEESLAEWIGDIPQGIWKVGVWVDESPALIEQISARLSLDVAKLHGKETTSEFPRDIRVWKAVRMLPKMTAIPEFPVEAMLLDGPGSGQTFDWSLVAGVQKPVVLAGGLTPENVQAAVQAVRPWGVDTASGVEASPGIKDHARMKLFIKAALNS